MQPNQQRYVDEKAALDDKLRKLKIFIDSAPTFTQLHDDERARLLRQFAAMEEYSRILGQRVAAF